MPLPSDAIIDIVTQMGIVVLLSIGFTFTYQIEGFPNFSHICFAIIGTTITFTMTKLMGHGGSHHAEAPGRIAQYAILNRYHLAMVAYFADKLKSIEEGEGNLLDHSVTLFGSNMGNSNQHLHYDVPMILVGGANGKLRGDRHLSFESRTVPTSNMLLSVLDMFGVEKDSFGDATGRLPGLA